MKIYNAHIVKLRVGGADVAKHFADHGWHQHHDELIGFVVFQWVSG